MSPEELPSQDAPAACAPLADTRAPRPFDLSVLAANGLRRGFTTGTSATAATKAALMRLLTGSLPESVDVSLPDGLHYLSVPITETPQETGWASASVIKDGGDDPDQTHQARITVRLRRNDSGKVVFLRGEGVGVVTQPGLRLAIGEPAINAVPRQMMRQALEEVLETPGLEQVSCLLVSWGYLLPEDKDHLPARIGLLNPETLAKPLDDWP